MKMRQITCVASNLSIKSFYLADVDVDIFIRHTKSMKPTSCVFVDNDVVYTGLFDTDRISQLKKKIKKQ